MLKQLQTLKHLIDNELDSVIEKTIKTIDGIIYAIPNRIKIEEIRIGR